MGVAAVLAAAMLAGWGAGWWAGRRLAKGGAEGPPDKFQDASIALLGLLLAFTFSMALSRHEQRRLMVVADSNAIGDFYTCASLLKEPVRGKLQTMIRTYVEHCLALATTPPDEASFEKKLDEIQEMQGRMQRAGRRGGGRQSPGDRAAGRHAQRSDEQPCGAPVGRAGPAASQRRDAAAPCGGRFDGDHGGRAERGRTAPSRPDDSPLSCW